MTLKILCLNILEGGLFKENIEAFITKENPDILCLQEVCNGDDDQLINFQSMKWLTQLLPEYHSFFAPELFEERAEGKTDIGNAIFSRFPITKTSHKYLLGSYERIVRAVDKSDFSKDPCGMQTAVINVLGTQFQVTNIHGIWGLDGGDNEARLTMSQIIVDEIKGVKPAVLMGDFNLKPNTQTIANIEKEMVNVFKDELVSTFNMKHKTNPGYATAVVDMFFMSRDIQVVSKSCPDDDVSDHKPLLVTIEL